MNIGVDLRCLQSTYRTGVGEYTFELLNSILKIDKQNNYFLFFNSFGDLPKVEFNYPNVKYAQFNFPNKIFNASALLFNYPKIDRLITKQFNLKKLDYFFSPNLNFTPLSEKTRHILTVHDLTFELFPSCLTAKHLIWHFLARPKKQCQTAFKILTPSLNTKRDLVNHYNITPGKITSIYPGISEIFTNFSNNDPTNLNLPDDYILFLGTLEPRKNLESVILAFENAQKFLPKKYYLVIAGAPGWKNKKINYLINNSTVREQIKLIGYVTDHDKPELYRRAKLFVYPSIYEGFGFPVLEAMHCGIPVITSNRSSMPELAAGAAHLLNPLRPEEISEAIIKILNNESYYSKLATAGKNRADLFRWSVAANNWLNMINA